MTCARCSTSTPGDVQPFTWSVERGTGGDRWLCPECTREHVRAIEARLDERWWAPATD